MVMVGMRKNKDHRGNLKQLYTAKHSCSSTGSCPKYEHHQPHNDQENPNDDVPGSGELKECVDLL